MKKIIRKDYVPVMRRYFVAEPAADGCGYSWTLSSMLGEALLFAEEKFGSRDKEYTILGLEFSKDGGQIWTPGNCKHLIIQLSLDCAYDRQDAYRQIAHECIHLLSPTGKKDASVLEEGLAVWYEQWYLNWCFGEGWWTGEINCPDYAKALAQTQQLLSYDPMIIKNIRSNQPTIARFTANDIMECCESVPLELAQELTRQFE